MAEPVEPLWGDPYGITDVVVCAHNESATIGPILDVISKSDRVGNLIVVADACDDDTANIASKHTSSVEEIRYRNKGSAMFAGLQHVKTGRVAFIDADIRNLTSYHVDQLLSTCPKGQSVGLYEWNSPAMWMPPISGNRCIPTGVAHSANLYNSGWEAEHRINAVIGRYGLPWHHFVLDGVGHDSKIVKGHPVGWAKTMFQVFGAIGRFGPDLLNYVTYPGGRTLAHYPRQGVLTAKGL